MFVRFLAVALVATVVWAVAARSSSGAGGQVVYTVKAGDTLWAIAGKRYAGDVRAGVWRIQQRNGLRDSTIRPGQRLVVPAAQ